MFEIRRILCVTDLSPTSDNAHSAAVRIAHRFEAHLTVLSCGEHFPYLISENFHENETLAVISDTFSQNYHKKLELLERHTQDIFKTVFEKTQSSLPKERINYEIRLESEVEATMEFLHEWHDAFDLVVVGKHKTSFLEKFLCGSPAKEISKKARVPTLLMPDEEIWYEWKPTGIAVGSALNESSSYAEDAAAYLASQLKLPLTLCHIIDPGAVQIETGIPLVFPVDYVPLQLQEEPRKKERLKREESLNHLKKHLQKKFNLPEVHTMIEFGKVGNSLVSFLSEGVTKNLIVIGSQGKKALVRFFAGSHSDEIEKECSIPILIARQRS